MKIRNILLVGAIFFIMTATACFATHKVRQDSASGTSTQSSLSDLFTLLAINPDEISSMELVYHEYAVPFTQSEQDDMIEKLRTSVPVEIDDPHRYTPSKCQLRFHLADERVIDAQFCWFSGFKPNPDIQPVNMYGTMVYSMMAADDRFDLVLGDSVYHFRITGKVKQTEMGILDLYNTFARYNKLPTIDQIDGNSGDIAMTVCYAEYPTLYKGSETWQEIVDGAKYVVTAYYIGRLSDLTPPKQKPYYYKHPDTYLHFEIRDCIKGELDKTLLLPAGHPEYIMDHLLYLSANSITTPPFIKDQKYLLCFSEFENWEEDSPPPIYFKEQSLNAMIIDQGKCYPCYNTEYHPFSLVPLSDIEAYLKK